jgi:hypothetical protein
VSKPDKHDIRDETKIQAIKAMLTAKEELL